jgi:hypothetical protein
MHTLSTRPLSQIHVTSIPTRTRVRSVLIAIRQLFKTLHSLLALRGSRMLFGHGPELADPWGELEALLES